MVGSFDGTHYSHQTGGWVGCTASANTLEKRILDSARNWKMTPCSFQNVIQTERWSQWPRSLRLRSAAARLLRLWVHIPLGAWMSICCECCVFSGRGLCNELITHPEESYQLWCIVVCDLETSWMRRPWPTGEPLRQKQTNTNWTLRK